MRHAWRVLAATLFALTLSNMDQSLFAYAVPGVMADLDVSLTGIGWMISASFALAIVAAFGVGGMTARFGPRLVVAVCLGVSAALVGAQAFAPDAGTFAAARVTGFALSAALIPVCSAYLATSTPVRWRAIAIAIQQCGYPFGWFIASLLAAPLITRVGWRASFLVAFAVIPLAFLVYALLPRHVASRATDDTPQAGLRELFAIDQRRIALTFGAAFFLYGGAVGGTSFYLPTFFQVARGYDAETATRIVGLSYAVGMIGYLGAALVSEYWLSRRTTVILWVWLGAVFLLATIWLPRSVTEDVWLFGLTTVFFYGSSSIMITSLLEMFPAALRTVAAAVSGTACISLGFVVFPVITAAAVDRYGWTVSFTLVIVPAIVAAGALLASLPRRAATTGKGLQAERLAHES